MIADVQYFPTTTVVSLSSLGNNIMNCIWRRTATLLIYRPLRLENIRPLHSLYKNITLTSSKIILNPLCVAFNPIRHKSKKQRQHDSDDEAEHFTDDSSLSKDSKLVKFSTTSMRTDAILKSALGVARNKIEQMFYESKIRVNGKKILKKSFSVKVGDEVDIIKMVSPNNSDHLYVARVEILDVTAKEDSISVSARRFKNLLIENYEVDPYKGSSADSET